MNPGHLFSVALFGPLLSATIIGLFWRSKHTKWCGGIASAVVWLSFVCIAGLFVTYSGSHETWWVHYFSWIQIGRIDIPFQFQLDSLSITMGLIVTGVGALIHTYAIGYMAQDASPFRFFAYMNLFIFSMLVLVFGANLPIMFIGWEGVGLCSYLLIGYWYEHVENTVAGMKAFVVNRIGDLGFILGIFGIYALFGTLNFSEIIGLVNTGTLPTEWHWGLLNLTALCLFLGAVGKSAQIPLYVWLPDAMAGPTPVSALIHAATMVTSGLVMMTRLGPFFQLAPLTSQVVLWIGVLTALLAAIIGVGQYDIKKVLAYSTVSQLGYMFAAMGVGAYVVGMFHVLTHAFFKALLFLGAGSVIVALHHQQDLRRMGGLKKRMPVTFWTMVTGTLALAGVFPFAGFFSKDEILFSVFAQGHGITVPYVLLLVGAFLTAFYMTRLMMMAFLGQRKPTEHHHESAIRESPLVMIIPLVVLAVFSIGVGFIGMPHFMSHHNLFSHFFEMGGFAVSSHPDISGAPLAAVSLVVALMGIFVGVLAYTTHSNIRKTLTQRFQMFVHVVRNKFFVDEIYDWTLLRPVVALSRFFWKFVDCVIIDGFVNGTAWVGRLGSGVLSRVQTGNVQTYAVFVLVGSVLLLLIFFQRFWAL